jgi:hypothetical protein
MKGELGMKTISALALMGVCYAGPPAWAGLVDGATGATNTLIAPYQFQASEDGTANPSYTYTGVPGYGSLTISYGPYFEGQGTTDPYSPPVSVTGTPTGTLALTTDVDPSLGTSDLWTVVEVDSNDGPSGQEVLGGTLYGASGGFGWPIALLFSAPVPGITLTVGDLSELGSTKIEAFDESGNPLGDVLNTATGYETFNLSESGGELIGGLVITSTESAGFGVDGVGVFDFTTNPVPAPGALCLLPGFAMLGIVRRRKRRGGGGAGP